MAEPSIIQIPRRVDNVTSAAVEADIGSALDAAPPALVLDFSDVHFVSSIGLRVLLMTAKRCRKQNSQLLLYSVPPQIVDLFGVSGLKTLFSMYPTREAALAAIA